MRIKTDRRFVYSIILLCFFSNLLYFVLKKAENIIGALVVEILQDEATKACENCIINTDEIKVSLLTLRAEAYNVTLSQKNNLGLRFRKIYAKIGLQEIYKLILHLDIDLINGDAYGVSEKSQTFKLIDQLTADSKKGAKKPFLKVKLDHLSVENSKFHEKLNSGTLEGSGLSLDVNRNNINEFLLSPKLSKLYYHSNLSNKNYIIGRLSSAISIKNGKMHFQYLLLNIDKSIAKATALAKLGNGNKLNGKTNFYLENKTLDILPWLSTELVGEGFLYGSLGNPKAKGKIFLDARKFPPLILDLPYLQKITLNKGLGLFKFDFNKGKPKGKVENIKAVGQDTEISPLSYIEINDSNIKSSVIAKKNKFNINFIKLSDIKVKVLSKGEIGYPFWSNLVVNAKLAEIPFIKLKNIKLNAIYKGSSSIYKLYSGKRLLTGRLEFNDKTN
jgi:hypothetical protein